jgi:hypothetical protein
MASERKIRFLRYVEKIVFFIIEYFIDIKSQKTVGTI